MIEISELKKSHRIELIETDQPGYIQFRIWVDDFDSEDIDPSMICLLFTAPLVQGGVVLTQAVGENELEPQKPLPKIWQQENIQSSLLEILKRDAKHYQTAEPAEAKAKGKPDFTRCRQLAREMCLEFLSQMAPFNYQARSKEWQRIISEETDDIIHEYNYGRYNPKQDTDTKT